MQQNVKQLQTIFPHAKVVANGVQAKAIVPSLLNDDFVKLVELGKENDVTAKRSGKSITIIVSPK